MSSFCSIEMGIGTDPSFIKRSARRISALCSNGESGENDRPRFFKPFRANSHFALSGFSIVADNIYMAHVEGDVPLTRVSAYVGWENYFCRYFRSPAQFPFLRRVPFCVQRPDRTIERTEVSPMLQFK